MNYKDQRGFTLIELMIVVVVIGILVAIGFANFYRVKTQSQEASVKSNMHSMQVMLENYAILHDGTYPVQANEPTFKATFPGSAYPENPFTNTPTILLWGVLPVSPGGIGLMPVSVFGYTMRAFGGKQLMTIILTNG